MENTKKYLSKVSKKHNYKLYDPQYKRILAIEKGMYRKNKHKKGCKNLTNDMKYMDKKYNLGTTKKI